MHPAVKRILKSRYEYDFIQKNLTNYFFLTKRMNNNKQIIKEKYEKTAGNCGLVIYQKK